MKVFISWSGEVSRRMALALQEWLPNVIQAVKPFLSSEDIRKGARWFSEIGSQLDATDFGILCLTRENMGAPWILFEAGALSKRVDTAHVAPLLIDLKPAELTGPLSHFNAVTSPARDEMEKLIQSMNAALGEDQLDAARLKKVFEREWQEFEKQLTGLAAERPAEAKVVEGRNEREMIEEILQLVRELAQGSAEVGGMRAVLLDVLQRQRDAARRESNALLDNMGLGLGGSGFTQTGSVSLADVSSVARGGGLLSRAMAAKQPPKGNTLKKEGKS